MIDEPTPGTAFARGQTVWIVPPVEIDIATITTFEGALARSAPDDEIIVDFSAVEFCDSTGIRALLDAWQRQTTAGGSLLVVGARAAVRRVFEITAVDDRLLPQ